jgi:phosphatidylglycerophosphatase A
MKKVKQKISSDSLRSVWQNPWHFLAFGFGTGLLPKMPGTWGTLAAIPIYCLLAELHYGCTHLLP